MTPEDTITYQNAIQSAQAGQTRIAYEQFCRLAMNPINRQFPDLLLWIAATTPYSEEAQRAINEVMSIAPHHPALPQAQAQLLQRQQPRLHMHFVQEAGAYSCPFCGTSVNPIIENRTSPVGRTVFFILLICIITIELCWIGLLIRETVVTCPMCRRNLKGYI